MSDTITFQYTALSFIWQFNVNLLLFAPFIAPQ